MRRTLDLFFLRPMQRHQALAKKARLLDEY